MLLLGIPGGTVAARLGAKRTLLLTQLLAAPLVALVPLLHYADLLTFPLLLVLVFLIGTLWTPFYAAQATIIPELIGEDERVVARGNAILQGAHRSTYWLDGGRPARGCSVQGRPAGEPEEGAADLWRRWVQQPDRVIASTDALCTAWQAARAGARVRLDPIGRWERATLYACPLTTRYRRQRSGTPFRSCSPASSKARPDPATRSFTVLDTRT